MLAQLSYLDLPIVDGTLRALLLFFNSHLLRGVTSERRLLGRTLIKAAAQFGSAEEAQQAMGRIGLMQDAGARIMLKRVELVYGEKLATFDCWWDCWHRCRSSREL